MFLYHSGNSYASQKVRIYLAEKEIAWESFHIDLLRQEQITDKAYRAIHPRGLVPALKDGTSVICNSTEIMEYIEAHYVKKSTPIDLKLIAALHDFCKRDEELHDPHLRTLSYYYLWMANEPTEEEKSRVLALAAIHPDPARGIFLARAIQRQITEKELESAKEAIMGALEDLEYR